MKGTPLLTAQHQSALPASQWSAGLGKSLREAEVLHQSKEPGLAWEIRRTIKEDVYRPGMSNN